MKCLDEYDNIDDAVADWHAYVEQEDYNKWRSTAELFKKIDTIRTGEVILGYFGFEETTDHDRMKTFLTKKDCSLYAIMPNSASLIPILNSDTLRIVTIKELEDNLSRACFDAIIKYRKYFNIKDA